jgi:hypothetical protein
MRSRITLLFFVLSLVAGTALAKEKNPGVAVHITPMDTMSDMFYFRGPIALRYQVQVDNPSPAPVTLKRLDLRTSGFGAYRLRADSTAMNVRIAPNSSTKFNITAWGNARGGYLSAGEPVILQGTAHLEGPSGSFVKIFQEHVLPY